MRPYTFTDEVIKKWLRNPEVWPTDDSYEIETLAPSGRLGQRETELRGQMPEWFWKGEKGSSILSLGTGKAYFERKFWSEFDNIYVIDPSEWTRRSLEHFSIPNAHFISKSLFDASLRLTPVPRYCWLGASLHDLFGEFYDWGFLRKLAMMVSDTLLVDAAVVDAETAQGQYLLSKWAVDSKQHYDGDLVGYRRSQFSYEHFRESIKGLWSVVAEWPTTWVGDGRRTLILKRDLPPRIQKDQLGPLELVCRRHHKYWDNWSVFRTREGYYKEIKDISPLLMSDAIGKSMGWDGFVRWAVYEEEVFCGFVVTDYGDQQPDDPSISEKLYLALVSRCLPLGFLPTDVAAENIRIHNGVPIWIDIDCLNLTEFDPLLALWSTTNTYKQYSYLPSYIDPAIYSGSAGSTYTTPTGLASNDDALLGRGGRNLDDTVSVDSTTLRVHTNEAVFLSQLLPGGSLRAGQRYGVSVTMKNTGTSTWLPGREYRLGSQNPQDNFVWGWNRVNLPSSVAPGASVTFSFKIIAPGSAGDHNFQWQMVQDGVSWFGSLTTNAVLRIR